MAHGFEVEELSAFLDKELPAGRQLEVEAHLRSCPACAKELERLQRAGAAFREHARQPLPAGLLERLRRRLRPESRSASRLLPMDTWVFVWTAALIAMVAVGGITLKRFMPGLFSTVQSMISGAAGSLGQGR